MLKQCARVVCICLYGYVYVCVYDFEFDMFGCMLLLRTFCGEDLYHKIVFK